MVVWTFQVAEKCFHEFILQPKHCNEDNKKLLKKRTYERGEKGSSGIIAQVMKYGKWTVENMSKFFIKSW